MTDRDIIRCVDDGANFYLRFFGEANHMMYFKNDYYSYIQPKKGEHGVKFVFDVKIESLSQSERFEIICELKTLKMPVWWDLQSSDDLYTMIHGKDKGKPVIEPADGDELYMAILPEDQINQANRPTTAYAKKVDTPTAFKEWATAVNNIMFGGYTDIHPVNHYHWCEKGLLNCFTCYVDDIPVSFASIMDNDKICSLEFVATDPNHRRQGFARMVCTEAMNYAFNNGAKIITLRALQPGTRELYTSLGYKIYNHAL
ncbi:MAG: GNAT family N-acetyltransferase [Eubacterium sp.]|nr:GNAT family N-acetyltransferase [Eubacterium sp.]